MLKQHRHPNDSHAAGGIAFHACACFKAEMVPKVAHVEMPYKPN